MACQPAVAISRSASHDPLQIPRRKSDRPEGEDARKNRWPFERVFVVALARLEADVHAIITWRVGCLIRGSLVPECCWDSSQLSDVTSGYVSHFVAFNCHSSERQFIPEVVIGTNPREKEEYNENGLWNKYCCSGQKSTLENCSLNCLTTGLSLESGSILPLWMHVRVVCAHR